MVAILELGLAWMVMATEEGGINRMHAGYLAAAGGGGIDSAELPFDLPFLFGAICFSIFEYGVLKLLEFEIFRFQRVLQ